MADELIRFSSGGSSTRIPRLELLYLQSLYELAERFEKGIVTHKEGAVNALGNQAPLRDRAFLTARAAHVIDHAMKYIAKLNGMMPDEGDNDAAAIMCNGMMLAEGRRALAVPEKNCAGCGGTGVGVTGVVEDLSGNRIKTEGPCLMCEGAGKAKS